MLGWDSGPERASVRALDGDGADSLPDQGPWPNAGAAVLTPEPGERALAGCSHRKYSWSPPGPLHSPALLHS